MSRHHPLRTTDALRLAGLDSRVWKGTASHHLYPEAPTASQDGSRHFDLDDIVCLVLFRELLDHGLTRTYAAMIASDVRRVMRTDPSLASVAVIQGRDAKGKPRPVVVVTPPPGAVSLFDRFSIAKYRAALEAPFAGFAS